MIEQTEREFLKITRNKSPGQDGTPNWVVCNFAGLLSASVRDIWNNSHEFH